MKLAYSVNGEGFGHASRMVGLVPSLERWHSIELFLPATVSTFVANKLPGKISQLIPSFNFCKKGDRILYAKTIWMGLISTIATLKVLPSLVRYLKRGKFDGVISDFEPVMAWAGRLAGLRVVQFNHPGIVLRYPKITPSSLMASIVSLMMEGPWSARLHCSFFGGDIGPIIRKTLRNYSVSQGDYVVLNLKDGYREAALDTLSAISKSMPNLHWRVFPNPNEDFEAALAGCRAVITAAGHQMLSEALVLGKPVLALPQRGQDEQQLNARMLERSGRGMTAQLSDLEKALPVFINRLPQFEAAFRQAPSKHFCFNDSTDQAVFAITRMLLRRRERKQQVRYMAPTDMGLPFESWQLFESEGIAADPDVFRVCVIGSGYVGLLSSAGLADIGHQCTGLDLDHDKVALLSQGKSPLFEPDLDQVLSRNIKAGRLRYTCDAASALSDAQVVFICVGTPSGSRGQTDLSYVMDAAKTIASHLQSSRRFLSESQRQADPLLIILKSTVPVGTTRHLNELIAKLSFLRPGIDFEVVNNPEFLREGKAVHDFFRPSRTVVGTSCLWAQKIAQRLYRPLFDSSRPLVFCDSQSSELAKYASNAMLASRISFVNDLAQLAEVNGANIEEVTHIMGLDSRIGPEFLKPGPGYGGSCFPKDNRSLLFEAARVNVELRVVQASQDANEHHKLRPIAKLLNAYGFKHESQLAGLTIGILGLAFKADTDDVRESSALAIVDRLVKLGCSLRLHDPQASSNFMRHFPADIPGIAYFTDPIQAAKHCQALLVLTPWHVYHILDWTLVAKVMDGSLLIDTRNIIDPMLASAAGLVLIENGKPKQARQASIRQKRHKNKSKL